MVGKKLLVAIFGKQIYKIYINKKMGKVMFFPFPFIFVKLI